MRRMMPRPRRDRNVRVILESEINANRVLVTSMTCMFSSAIVLNSSETDKNVYSLQRYLGSPSISVENREFCSYSPSYSSEEGVVAGHSGQFASGGYLSAVVHTTLAGIEPTTLRLLVRRATSRATETTVCFKRESVYEGRLKIVSVKC